jgi:hypothetical protein
MLAMLNESMTEWIEYNDVMSVGGSEPAHRKTFAEIGTKVSYLKSEGYQNAQAGGVRMLFYVHFGIDTDSTSIRHIEYRPILKIFHTIELSSKLCSIFLQRRLFERLSCGNARK